MLRADGRREQERVLLRVADRAAHGVERQIAHVLAVEEHAYRAASVASAASSTASVDLPVPVRPTIATNVPRPTSKLTSVDDFCAPYANERPRTVSCPAANRRGQAAVGDLGLGLEDLRRRTNAARPRWISEVRKPSEISGHVRRCSARKNARKPPAVTSPVSIR